MNEKKDIVLDSDFDSQLAMWCNHVEDTNDLAGMADRIIQLILYRHVLIMFLICGLG